MLRKIGRLTVDRMLLPVARHIYWNLRPSPPQPPPPRTVIDVLFDRALTSSAEYVEDNMPRAMKLASPVEFRDYVVGLKMPSGIVAEFGVWRGHSINQIAERLGGRTVFGFDSFEGLQEDWHGFAMVKGTFSLAGNLPQVRENVRLLKGWFNETLPPFLSEHRDPLALVHVDCDTYDTSKPLLTMLAPRFQPGTIVMFDEYLGYPGWKSGEWKAWREIVNEHRVRYEYLAVSIHQTAVRILEIGSAKVSP